MELPPTTTPTLQLARALGPGWLALYNWYEPLALVGWRRDYTMTVFGLEDDVLQLGHADGTLTHQLGGSPLWLPLDA